MRKPYSKKALKFVAVALPLLCVTTVSSAQTLYSNNFEGHGTGSKWLGVNTSKVIQDPTKKKGGKVLEIIVPKGGSRGITKKIALSKKVESACLTYDIFFTNGFEFKRGKLPGLEGGSGNSGCASAKNGFSNRFIFQPGGKIDQYQYFPDKRTRCGTPTNVGKVTTGKWYTFKTCITLGTPGKNNGTWESWIDGKGIGKRSIKWRNSNSLKISHLMFHTFYSNSKPGKQVKVLYDNVKVTAGGSGGGGGGSNTGGGDSGGSNGSGSSGSKSKGLRYEYYEGKWSKLPNFNKLKAKKSGNVGNFSLSPKRRKDYFAMRFKGYVDIKKNGRHTFYVKSDEGSKLFINGKQVVNNDGKHSARERSGSITLKKGLQKIEVHYFEYKGGETLAVKYKGPGFGKRSISNKDLYRD